MTTTVVDPAAGAVMDARDDVGCNGALDALQAATGVVAAAFPALAEELSC